MGSVASTPAGSGAQGARALKASADGGEVAGGAGFLDGAAAEALAKEHPDKKQALEEHAAGNFSTADVAVEAAELDEADRELLGVLEGEEDSQLGGLSAFNVTSELGQEKVVVAARCLASRAAAAPSAAPRVALFLHGLGSDRSLAMWSRFWAPALADGFHVVSLDLPGFGRSSGEEGKKDADAELLLRLIAALKLPDGCVSVFAEGVGGCAFLKAFAKDKEPFAAHHVLLNVQIGSLPPGLKENLESGGASLLLCVCERFFDGQDPFLCAAAATMLGLLFDPAHMGQFGEAVLWKVKDAELAKKTGGSGEVGLSPFKSMRAGDWWTGRPEKIKGLARDNKAFIMSPSEECASELLSFAAAPRRRVRNKDENLHGPDKSAIEMGEINESFQVFIRVRPLNDREKKKGAENCFEISDTDFPRDPPPQRIVVQGPAADDKVKGNFVFNRVFCESHGQEEVYAGAVKPYVADFLQGTNVTVFAYGQTGTGKTYTIMGPKESEGLIPRCLSEIFEGMPADQRLVYEYVQLYMDDFKDLLVEERKGELKIVEGKSGVRLSNLSSRQASSRGDILAALEEGSKRRATRAQDMNEVSSRSHAVLMLRLVGKDDPDDAPPAATMSIVDLAGSERVARSGVQGQGFDEATSINQSLSALGRVVVALIDSDGASKRFIPYSSSPLTMVLKGGLGGNSKTALIACVTQAEDSIGESMSTLRFAMQSSHVKNKVAKKDAKDKADQEQEKMAAAGNTLAMEGGKGVVPLPTGPVEVFGSWSGDPGGRCVVLVGDLGAEVKSLQGLIDALAAEHNCSVLAPQLPSKTEKELEKDVEVLVGLLDWLGISQPVFYGRDWGGVRVCKLKLTHPKRAKHLVLEAFKMKVDEKEYKARCKKDPGYVMSGMTGPFLWFYDGAFPQKLDGKPGKNMQGFKAKASLLWPMHSKGKHDPQGKGAEVKVAQTYAKILNTKLTDSFKMGDAEVAAEIAKVLPS